MEQQKEEKEEIFEFKQPPLEYNCKFCDKTYKGKNAKNSLNKHVKSKHPIENKPIIVIEDKPVNNEKDLDKLKKKFKNMVMNNPTYDLKKEIATNKDLHLIDQMNKNEVQARIIDFQRNYAKKLDKQVSKTCLDITAIAIGSVLDIQQELSTQFNNDILLQESLNEVLSGELLCHIDPKLKILALGSSDVGIAIVNSMPRWKIQKAIALAKKNKNNVTPPEFPIEEKKEENKIDL
jgi:hypothetical protein